MESRTVFIIDDDKFLSDMYSLKFTQAGFIIDTAGSGVEALAKLGTGYNPTVILLDIVMPVMDGFEFLEELRKKKMAKSSAVIILSNLCQKDDIEKGMKLGIDGYIVKASCTTSEVLAKVEEVLKKNKKDGLQA